MTKYRQTKRVTDRVVRLCTSGESVSSLVAKDPTLAPGDAWKRLYGDKALGAGDKEAGDDEDDDKSSRPKSATQEDLERAARCGRWGPTKPSDLFLRIYHDALCTIDEDPLNAMVSPSLMGSHGTIPLTVISVMPDIVRHMSNVIARAEREVFLATNYWQNSVASKYITNAIRELDRRAGARGERVVLKILYDRGSPRQLYTPHYIVSEKEATGKNVGLPRPSDIPNIDMEVMNFHTPLLGTFHAKYMVVDRKIALLQSNNIQDNDNLEMLIHLEGPIVDSLYDTALISWHKSMNPPLPSLASPSHAHNHASHQTGNTFSETVVSGNGANGAVFHGDGTSSPSARNGDGPGPNGGTVSHSGNHHRTTQPRSLPEHTADDPHYDEDTAGEAARSEASLAPKPGETHLQAVTRLLNHTVNEGFPGDPDAPECPPGELMTPYITHPTTAPFPMALVNRPPYGPPTHRSVSTPQNAAWLSALRNAQESVYIISPTLNAGPLIPAILDACERGVHVHCYICISYNDAGELLPRQGGHNEKVAVHLHRSLRRSPAARARLHYHWYVAKDQTKPITQAARRRSSHVKLLIADGRVGVQGNGNQDTQSWFHSCEVNVLVDSADVCRDWMEALRRNMNTEVFGRVEEDGVWRDGRGREVEGAIGVDTPRVRGWVKGLKGAVERVRGTGGF